MELDEYTTKLAELNPCIKFIVDNYELLCRVYPGRVVMTMNAPGMDATLPIKFRNAIPDHAVAQQRENM